MTTFSGAMPSLWAECVDDALVGLVRHEPVDVGGGIAGGAERILDHVGDHRHRVLEHRSPFHAQVADGLRRGRPAIDVELGLVPAVGAQMRGQHAAIVAAAGLLLRLHHDGAGAVAEQHAGGAVVPIEDARERLRADHQRALVGPRAQQAVGDRKPVHEAGAHRLQVERGAARDAEPGLHR